MGSFKQEIAGKKVLIVGAARSGVAAAKQLCALGAQVTLNDSKGEGELPGVMEEIRSLPIARALGCPAMDCLQSQQLMVISPGVPIQSPFIAKARQMGIEVIGEIELAFRLCPEGVRLAAITGTNGKTYRGSCGVFHPPVRADERPVIGILERNRPRQIRAGAGFLRFVFRF